MEDKLFAVVVATYQRSNGSTPAHLTNLAQTLKKQTYQNYHIFLTGDKYEDEKEFWNLVKLFPESKITAHNNEIAYREGTFGIRRNKWTSGGLLACYRGLKEAIERGYRYYVHLDDDDSWSEDHLHTLQGHILEFPESDFLYTRTSYMRGVLPRENVSGVHYNNLHPRPGQLVNSASCVNLKTPILSDLLEVFENRKDTIEKMKRKEIKEYLLDPFDMAKWTSVLEGVRAKGFKTLFIPKITCYKPTDGNIPL